MKALRQFFRRIKGFLGERRSESDLAAELESHLRMQAEENERRGMTPGEARRHALVSSGGIEQARQNYRQQETLPFLETLFQDARYGVRMLRKNPGFTAVAAVTLALGIGANSAIFSVVNGVLLRPLPYPEPSRLISISNTAPSKGLDKFGASPPDFRRLRSQNHTLASLSAFYHATFNLTGGDKPERLLAAVVTPEYFSTLGVKPRFGRAFLAGEETFGAHRVMVVSHSFWRSHLNSDPDISGKTFSLDGDPYLIVGVMPPEFYTSAFKVEAWVPMAWKSGDNMDTHNNYFVNMVGRLRPGITQAQAASDLNAIMLQIAEQFPENRDIGVGLKSLAEDWLGDSRPALLVLLCAVGLVLLIACANLANLLLARFSGREKEIGIRSALGASRGRLVRQFITESLVLALISGAIGLALAYFSLGLLPMAGSVLPRIDQVRVDGWVLLLTGAVSVVTGLLFSLIPALQSSRSVKLNESLKEGGRTGHGVGNGRLRGGLVISEVALALVLLIASGLAIRSLQKLFDVDSGFSRGQMLTFDVSLPDAYDPQPDPARLGSPPRVAEFFRETVEGIEHLPGVKAAGIISNLPLNGENWSKFFVALDRPLPSSLDATDHVQYRAVYGHTFGALGVHLVNGRFLDEHDQATTTPSVVINETLARKYWPNADPVGRLIMLNPPVNLIPKELIPRGAVLRRFAVVGVVSDVHYGGLDQKPEPLVYASALQEDSTMSPAFAVRTEGDPKALVGSIRSIISRFDKNLPMANVLTMNEIVSTSVAQPKLEAVLLGFFGGLAMVLAAVGIYGVISYSVSQRKGEIGIRMALGASRGNVLALICKQGLMLAAVGVAAGVALALAATRLMAKVLFGVTPTDPATFIWIILLVAAVTLLACYIPARRATRVDPIVALRHE
ncbi:MAG TPA: ABC transporter permease [Candidatus Angelobacter sp.]|nr:ABC transporter permease [Candidatus Angelobacter sp.]